MLQAEITQQFNNNLLSSDQPSAYFEQLKNNGQLDPYFPELKQLIGISQDPEYHPEGDVWNHTMEVIDRAAAYRAKSSNPLAFMLLALTHDFGKISTTELINGRWHSYKHEIKGIPMIEKFLHRVTDEQDVVDYVLKMVPIHMKPGQAAVSKTSVKSTNHMFDEAVSPEDLIYLSLSDKADLSEEDEAFLWDRLKLYRNIMSRPYVTENDLINARIRPDDKMEDLLEYAHKLRLAGIEKDDALVQVLGYSRNKKRK